MWSVRLAGCSTPRAVAWSAAAPPAPTPLATFTCSAFPSALGKQFPGQ